MQSAAFSGASAEITAELETKIKVFLASADMNDAPPKTSRDMHRLIREILGNPDPYRQVKEEYNALAMQMRPGLEHIVINSADPLETAIRISIAGNVIDFGTHHDFDLSRDVNDVLKKEFAVFDYAELKGALSGTNEVLFLGDNTGEVVFDALLLSEIKKRYGCTIKYAVKASPILNDALREDALFAGIDEYAEIIDSGADSPGIVPDYASDEFRELLFSSKLIISKGQGNFEALNTLKLPVFFMLKLKCPVVAGYSGHPEGSILMMKGKNTL